MNHPPEVQSAHAILLVSGRYALQLRDEKPTISAPGAWSLFGGMIREGEAPLETIIREIEEELCIKPGHFQSFGFRDYYSSFEDDVIRTWFFVADATGVWDRHILTEGQSSGLFPFEELSSLTIPPVMRQVLTQFHQGKSLTQLREGRNEHPDKVGKASSTPEGDNR